MSGVLVEKLRRRAMVFLREARRLAEEGEYDLSVFNAGQAAQLYTKAIIARLLGEAPPRVHGVRELLGYLARGLRDAGYREEAELIAEFVRRHRDTLSMLEDAYTDARYGVVEFTAGDAEEALSTFEELIQILRRVEERVSGGWIRHRIEYLRKWRHYVSLLARSVRELLPGAEVYVFGGAAEDRLTVLSDVDVLVVVDRELNQREKWKLKADIIWNATKYGFPWDYPVDLHIVSRRELPRYLRHAKKLVRVEG